MSLGANERPWPPVTVYRSMWVVYGEGLPPQLSKGSGRRYKLPSGRMRVEEHGVEWQKTTRGLCVRHCSRAPLQKIFDILALKLNIVGFW